MTGITTVVFDADETLVDLPPAVEGGLIAVLDEVRRLDPETALTLVEMRADWTEVFAAMAVEPVTAIRRAALARSLERAGFAAELDRMAELFFAHRYALTRPYPDALGTLAELRRGYAVGFATNGNSRADRCGLAGQFAFEIYAFESGVPKKPAPAFYAAVLAAAGCPPESAVYVGDSWAHDVVAADAAGLRAVWVNRHGRPRPPGPTPLAEIASLAELPAVLSAC